MLRLHAELEDVTIEAERDMEPNAGLWTVRLSETDNGISSKTPIVHTIILDDEGMGFMMYLAAGGDHDNVISREAYAVLEPKLKGVPVEVRPIP